MKGDIINVWLILLFSCSYIIKQLFCFKIQNLLFDNIQKENLIVSFSSKIGIAGLLFINKF